MFNRKYLSNDDYLLIRNFSIYLRRKELGNRKKKGGPFILVFNLRPCCFSLSTSYTMALIGSKVTSFSLYSILTCLTISGSLRLISVIRLSEEAGIQCLGQDDNVAIWSQCYQACVLPI